MDIYYTLYPIPGVIRERKTQSGSNQNLRKSRNIVVE